MKWEVSVAGACLFVYTSVLLALTSALPPSAILLLWDMLNLWDGEGLAVPWEYGLHMLLCLPQGKLVVRA